MSNKKAYPFLYLFLSVWIISGSCTKLDEEVYDQVLESSFVPTEKDIPNIIGPVYTQMRGMMANPTSSRTNCFTFSKLHNSAAILHRLPFCSNNCRIRCVVVEH